MGGGLVVPDGITAKALGSKHIAPPAVSFYRLHRLHRMVHKSARIMVMHRQLDVVCALHRATCAPYTG